MTDPCVPGYRLVGPLGAGGMASVYLAVQESLDRHVALKVLAPALAADQAFAGRFLKEGRITARLSHPHLVTVFDIGQQGSTYYLATEYLPGGTLGDKVRSGISVAESLVVACDIAGGLHYAHDAGFVHRDVKPSNVMFRANGAAVLADFGIAKSMDGRTAVTQAGSLVGTPRYMSPEQISAGVVDGRSDLYSLGVVLFELLTGKPPYEAGEPLTVALMHLTHPLPQLPAALAWLQPLIDGLMAKEAGARFASGEAFVAAVDNLLAQAPEGMGVRDAPEARKRATQRISSTDLHLAAAQSPAISAAPSTPLHASGEPGAWRLRATARRNATGAMLAALVALLVLGGAAAWKSFSPRAGLETARSDEICRAAVASVAVAISEADLTRAEAKSAAIPDLCSAHPQVSPIRASLKSAMERAASARNSVHALLGRGDVPGARNALGELERVDLSASDLPELRMRLAQVQGKDASDQNAAADPAPAAMPQAPLRKEVPSDAIGHEVPETPPSQRPRPDGSAPVRRPSTAPSGQQSQTCREISLRAGLGEETAEERKYISENCR